MVLRQSRDRAVRLAKRGNRLLAVYLEVVRLKQGGCDLIIWFLYLKG